MNIAVTFSCLVLCLFSRGSNSYNIFSRCGHFDGIETVELECTGKDWKPQPCFAGNTRTSTSLELTENRSKVKHLRINYGSMCTDLDRAPLDGFFWNVSHLHYANTGLTKFYSNLRFHYLEVFDASHNKLGALWPAIFEGQSNLRELDFSFNYISIILEKSFDQTPKLSTINLAQNSLSTIDAKTFSTLHELKTLDLSYNQIVSIDELAFQSNKQLEQLNLQANPLKQFDCHLIDNLQNLHAFNVSLHSIVALDLDCEVVGALDLNSVPDDVPNNDGFSISMLLNGTETKFNVGLGIASNWRHLNIAGFELQSVADVFNYLGSQLEYLDVSSNHVGELTADTFAHFPNLKYLKLSNTNLSVGAATNPFHRQTELIHLDLSYNENLRVLDFTPLSSTLSHLIELNVAGCRHRNASAILELLSDNIEVLNLAFNQLFEINDQTFQRFPKLKSLNLSATVDKRFELSAFFHQNQLIELDLSDNNWKNNIDFSILIRRFKQLEVLNIEGNYLNRVRGLTPSIFPKLKMLGLSRNRFTCQELATLLDGWPDLELIYNPSGDTHIDGIDCSRSDSI